MVLTGIVSTFRDSHRDRLEFLAILTERCQGMISPGVCCTLIAAISATSTIRKIGSIPPLVCEINTSASKTHEAKD